MSMRRFMVGGMILILLAGCVFWFYKNSQYQRDDAYNQKMFDVVMAEKMQQLYDQAQNWEQPIRLDVHDKRLYGDYKIMSEFLLNYWMENAEARNLYLRELKAAKWDKFLDVDRLDRDRQQNYVETTQMLADVKMIETSYLQDNSESQQHFLNQARSLSIHPEMKAALLVKINQKQDQRKEYALFNLEQQIYSKAEQMFELLKNHRWQKQEGKISFYDTAQVKQFNQLYQDVLRLNEKIEKIKSQNAQTLEQDVASIAQ
ncbi:hypothetical protein D7V21_14135 [Acinetobacter guerrae]|uniref:Uncharacterized protein n=2 Tax=Acinetobacter guerrae TaxID=1843371 RepID=A0A3A8EKU8_9GAMM|nr:hypothetical protein D7V21_14135 [Acinetobacter guerrae]